jgi:hypothetical protein
MVYVGLYSMYLAVPLVSLACLVFGIWRHGRCGVWVLGLALVPPFFMLVIGLLNANVWLPVWMAVCVLTLAAAAGASRHESRVGRFASLLGMALPAPAMVYLLYMAVFAGALHWEQMRS